MSKSKKSFFSFLGGYFRSLKVRGQAEKIFDSVGYIVAEDKWGQPVATGSSFFVSSDTVVTTCGSISGAVKGHVITAGGKGRSEITGVTTVDKEMGLVLLKLDSCDGEPVVVNHSNSVTVGDRVWVMGRSSHSGRILTEGRIASVHTVGEDSLLRMNGSFRASNCGGPVLNKEGKLIGIANGTFVDTEESFFVIGGQYVRQLRQETEQVRAMGECEEEYKSDLLFGLGRNIRFAATGTEVKWRYSTLNSGEYSFLLGNKLRWPVRDVSGIVVFYDENNEQVGVDRIKHRKSIGPGLSVTIKSKVDGQIQTKAKRTEFRVLDFEISEIH